MDDAQDHSALLTGGHLAKGRANESPASRPSSSIPEIKAAVAVLNKDDIPGTKKLIEAALSAKLSKIEAMQVIKALAKRLGVPKAAVESLWCETESAMRIANAPTETDRHALRPPRTITESRYEGVRRRDSGRQDSGSRRTLVSRMG